MDPRIDVTAINAAVRQWIRGLSGAAKQELASKLGVSLRTVQRWAVEPGSGKQARAYLPKRFASIPTDQWPQVAQDRANVALAVGAGITRSGGLNERLRSVFERFRSLEDAQRYIQALREGKVDRFIDATWRTARIVPDGSGWRVTLLLGIPVGLSDGEGGIVMPERGPVEDYVPSGDRDTPAPDVGGEGSVDAPGGAGVE